MNLLGVVGIYFFVLDCFPLLQWIGKTPIGSGLIRRQEQTSKGALEAVARGAMKKSLVMLELQ